MVDWSTQPVRHVWVQEVGWYVIFIELEGGSCPVATTRDAKTRDAIVNALENAHAAIRDDARTLVRGRVA